MESASRSRYYKAFEHNNHTEEIEITRLIFDRLKKENCLLESDRETISYRIAEIMVTAKQMYTQSLPRLTNVNGESSQTAEDDLTGLQMTFTHLCDLMHDFQSAYLQALRVPEKEEEEKAAGLDGRPMP